MNTFKQLKTALKVNRLLIAVGAMVAIWTDTPISEVAATISTLLWIYQNDAVRLELKLFKKAKGE